MAGIHNVYISFRGQSDVGNFDWFQFEKPFVVPPLRLGAEQNDDMSGIVISNTMVSGNDGTNTIPNTVIKVAIAVPG